MEDLYFYHIAAILSCRRINSFVFVRAVFCGGDFLWAKSFVSALCDKGLWVGGRSHSILSPKEGLPKKIECTENADSIPREVKAYGQDFPIVTGTYPYFSTAWSC